MGGTVEISRYCIGPASQEKGLQATTRSDQVPEPEGSQVATAVGSNGSHGGVLARKFEQEDKGVIYQWIVPPGQTKKILHQLHGGPMGAHLGEDETLGKLRERFYWPGHVEYIKNWCSSCELCEQRKNPTPKNKAPLVSIHTCYPMQRVAIDILGPLPETQAGNSYVLVVADYFT